jgi:hypothetical protein
LCYYYRNSSQELAKSIRALIDTGIQGPERQEATGRDPGNLDDILSSYNGTSSPAVSTAQSQSQSSERQTPAPRQRVGRSRVRGVGSTRQANRYMMDMGRQVFYHPMPNRNMPPSGFAILDERNWAECNFTPEARAGYAIGFARGQRMGFFDSLIADGVDLGTAARCVLHNTPLIMRHMQLNNQ